MIENQNQEEKVEFDLVTTDVFGDEESVLENNSDVEALLILKTEFYDRLRDVISASQKDKQKSVILTLIQKDKNTLIRCLNEASVDSQLIRSKDILDNLLKKEYIREGYEFSHYILTARGIWTIDQKLRLINFQILLDHLDKKMIPKFNGKFNDKDKAIILTLIGIRAFSEKTPMIRKSELQVNKTQEIIDIVVDFLKKKESIEKDTNIFASVKSNEEKVASILRRVTDLPDKTRGIYHYGQRGTYSYWLDIYNEDTKKIDERKLSYLLWNIFGGDLTLVEQDEVNKFCSDILRNYKNYVYEDDIGKNFKFFDAKYTRVISDSLFNIINFKDLWERN